MHSAKAILASMFALMLASCAQPAAHDMAAPAATSAKPKQTTTDYRRSVRGDVQAFNSARVIDWERWPRATAC
jgi:ABC-type glycerol-3-phosphate transport system substrate-binding protein